MRLRGVIAYDGTEFCGWQVQKGYPTIQSELEGCLQRISGRFRGVTGAGRTDSGVHAFGQVAHFDWDNPLPPDKLLLGMNAILPESIRVLSLESVHPEFHARFDAQSKFYLYRIDQNRVYNPFTYRYALHYRRPLDLDLLRHCVTLIVGEHDFSAFQATGTEVVSTTRNVMTMEIVPEVRDVPSHPPLMHVRIQANGFLRKMVRFIIGTLLEIGSGRRPVSDLEQALQTGDRRFVGIPAAARGLFLEQVIY